MAVYRPTLEEAKALAAQGNLAPIYREVPADLETPVSAFLKVARGRHSFLLESVEGGERLARYSFIGTEPYRVLRNGPRVARNEEPGDPLTQIEQELSRFCVTPVEGLPRFHGGAVGYLGYEVVRHFEPRVPAPEADPLGLPDAIFLFTDTLLVFDHLQHVIKVVSHLRLDGDIEAAYRQAVWRIEELVGRLSQPLAALPYRRAESASGAAASEEPQVCSNMSREEYQAKVERIKEYIVAGDCIQVVFSQRFSRPTRAHPFDIYRALRTVNPSPYMFYLELGDFHLVGASPEMLVRVEEGAIDYHPIAGTRPRGRDAAGDAALEEELRRDEKERAEHIMLVDLGRNDVGRVSEPGTVQVTQLMDVERYSHVMHLVSHVTGRLRADMTSYDALRACFPAGTVSGAPKIRAMEIIAELERARRGPYAGAVGYFDLSGNLDTCITLRTTVVKDDVAYVQAGGGIVYDSEPEREYQETVNKAQALLRAIERAEEATEAAPQGSLGY
ncbi:MAG: anthranilate synthase component I [Chloroflexi bacterium RBG_16_68_14]|nr:MAG: anthranilate synthase component I [Chloroflexi bacterium RBG_16_68_14]